MLIYHIKTTISDVNYRPKRRKKKSCEPKLEKKCDVHRKVSYVTVVVEKILCVLKTRHDEEQLFLISGSVRLLKRPGKS